MKLPTISMNRYRVTTEPLRSERKIELAVLLLALVLCLQLLYSGARLLMLGGPSAIPPAADALNVHQIQSTGGVTAEQRGEIVTRPLFWESRRPLDEPAIVAEEEPSRGKVGQLKGVKLLGVFGGGETAGIIVQVKDKKRRILLGEEIRGWSLQSVAPDRVVLAADGRTSELVLHVLVSEVPEVDTQAPPRAKPAGGGSEDELSLGGSGRT